MGLYLAIISNKLIILQNKLFRCIYHKNKLDSTDEILKSRNILKVTSMHKYFTMLLIHYVINFNEKSWWWRHCGRECWWRAAGWQWCLGSVALLPLLLGTPMSGLLLVLQQCLPLVLWPSSLHDDSQMAILETTISIGNGSHYRNLEFDHLCTDASKHNSDLDVNCLCS